MAELVVEIHVPLTPTADAGDDDYPFPWIDYVDEFLASLAGREGEQYDDGEEVGEEYVFFVSGAAELQLLALAQQVASLPGVPPGTYAVVTDTSGLLSEGRRVDLRDSGSAPKTTSLAAQSGPELAPVTHMSWISAHANGAWDEAREQELALPVPYESHFAYLVSRLNADPAWWGWWSTARDPQSKLWFWATIGLVANRRTIVRYGKDFAGRGEVNVTLKAPAAEFDHDQPAPGIEEVASTPAVVARAHVELLLDTLVKKFGVEVPAELRLPVDTARLERERLHQEAADRRASLAALAEFEATNALRSSATIWRGRAPDDDVDALVDAVRAGKRIVALPQLIADLRHRHRIPVAVDDPARLAVAGYSPAEIAVALA